MSGSKRSGSVVALLAAGIVVVTLGVLAPPAALAQTAGVGPSGLPLPRFVSLKAGRVNARIGPGLNYPVDWLYLKPGLPMEIVQEYDNWRRVRDAEGAEVWINQSLLSGRRTAIAAPWHRGKESLLPLKSEPQEEARVVASVEPGAMGRILQCNGDWCQMEFSSATGWMEQTRLWGAYPGERVKD